MKNSTYVKIETVTPLIFNLLCLVLVVTWYQQDNSNYYIAYTLGIVSFIVTIGSLLMTIRAPAAPFLTIGSALLNAVFFVFVFAAIYQIGGIEITEPVHENWYRNFLDSVYFSTVTTTTLGYGDMTAPHSLKMLSAIQSLLGFIYLGVMISIVGTWVSRMMDVDKELGAD